MVCSMPPLYGHCSPWPELGLASCEEAHRCFWAAVRPVNSRINFAALRTATRTVEKLRETVSAGQTLLLSTRRGVRSPQSSAKCEDQRGRLTFKTLTLG